MAFRRRKGATVILRFNTNPKLIPDDSLAAATKREIHVMPPVDSNGVARPEIILEDAEIVDVWKLQATLTPAQHQYEGQWQADAYAEFGSGAVVKIGRTVQWTTDPKYKTP